MSNTDPNDGGEAAGTLIATLRKYAEEAAAWHSPMYAYFSARMAEDVEARGPTWDLLQPYAAEPPAEYYGFRALAGVHHMVLSGELPQLRAHYPSEGGDGDAEAAWPLVRAALEGMSPEILDSLRHPLQTNETARCGALVGGFLTVAAEAGLPLRVRELGASAGLNMHFDRYRYEQDGRAFGPADSPVRFVDHWLEGVPPFEAELEVASRRGCDLEPIDPTSTHGRTSLLAYILPDQLPRYELLREAIEVAQGFAAEVDREGIDTWIARELADPPAGEATVVFHSLVWIYLDDGVRASTAATIEAAAGAATAERPLSWLRYELGPDLVECELRLRSWPGGEDRLLATGDVHLAPVRWLA
jgi:hypothetical protein